MFGKIFTDPITSTETVLAYYWDDKRDDILKGLEVLSSTQKNIRSNIDAIFKGLFGEGSEIARAIVQASSDIEKRDREIRKELELAKKELELEKKEHEVAGGERDTSAQKVYMPEHKITLGLSRSNNDLYEEEFALLKEYETFILKFLKNQKQTLYVFFSDVRSEPKLEVRRTMINLERRKKYELAEGEPALKFSIFQTVVLLTIAYTTQYDRRFNTNKFPHNKVYNKYQWRMRQVLFSGFHRVFPIQYSPTSESMYIGDDPEGKSEYFRSGYR